jgi:thymidylate kinase
MMYKNLIEIVLAISTPLIAYLAVYYTRSQSRTDELRRKQELFQIRYTFYQKVRATYLSIAESKKPVDETDFFDLAEEASFLFGDDVSNHILEFANHKIPIQVNQGIIDDWFLTPFKKYLQLK